MPQKLSIPNLSLQDRLAARKPQSALARALALEAEGKPERAFKLFVIAAEAGMTEAERELGEHYLSGRGVLRNRVEAARWFARAADKGDLTACRHLAGLYMTGVQESEIADASTALFNAPPKPGSDCGAALRYAMQAAEAGDVRAQEMAAAIHLLVMLDRAVQCHPGHHLGMHKMLARTAGLPDAVIGLHPHMAEVIDQLRLDRSR